MNYVSECVDTTMFVEQALLSAKNVRNALSTIAALLQLTSYRYPLPANVLNGACYDYIVVGAGTAGSVVANRLTEDPNVSVLLIEAGGDPPIESNLAGLRGYLQKSRLDWNHTSQTDRNEYECHQNNHLHMTTGKLLGGTSSINYMFYVRGDPYTFNTWADMTGDDSWNYTNVLPYFKKSERLQDKTILKSSFAKFHGTSGYLGISRGNKDIKKYLDSFEEMGYKAVLDTNGDNTLGFNEPSLTLADGIRQSTANAFLSNIKERPNLHVMKGSLVTKIEIDRNKRATAVQILNQSKETLTVRANKEIIVSAGPLNSPQLLMLSGIGPKDTLKKIRIKPIADLPVGEQLQSHRLVSIFIKTSKPSVRSGPTDPRDITVALANGFIALNKSQSVPDIQAAVVSANSAALVGYCSVTYAYKNDLCQYLYEKNLGNDTIVLTFYNFDQKPRGRVGLKSLDPEDSPLIHMYPFPDDIDFEKHIRYIRDLTRLLNTRYFKSVDAEFISLPKCEGFGVGSNSYWKCYLKCLSTTVFHYSSTCAMGSVVDSRLRVRGVRGLRVADAGVMPTTITGNPMAATIMIGEKAADMIKEDNKRCKHKRKCTF